MASGEVAKSSDLAALSSALQCRKRPSTLFLGAVGGKILGGSWSLFLIDPTIHSIVGPVTARYGVQI
jgi:hypothetical protein